MNAVNITLGEKKEMLLDEEQALIVALKENDAVAHPTTFLFFHPK